MIIIGQFLDVALALILIFRLVKLGLHSKYKAFLAFLVCDSVESIIYLAFVGFKGRSFVDYRILWCGMELVAWAITIWAVYAFLIALLKQLPGILRFSLYLLNAIFGISVVIGLFTVRPQFKASPWALQGDLLMRVTAIAAVIDRALSFSELLAILATVTFLLFFPLRVPRNLAVFTVGFCTYLVVFISIQLAETYLPGLSDSRIWQGAPGYLSSCCLVYWLFSVDRAGDTVPTLLGRNWQSVPQEHLVRQLEAMNAALLRSREQV